MAFQEMTDDLDIISKYPDEPYEEEGFSSSSFRAAFDKAGKLCKSALNGLILALGMPSAAANIGYAASTSVQANTVQDAIEAVQRQIAGVSQGAVPDGSIGGPKLAELCVTGNKLASESVTGEKVVNGSLPVEKIDAESLRTFIMEIHKYAVGDIFVTTRSGNPADLLGYGTWLQIKDRFLLAAGDNHAAGSTGGEETHTLTLSEMPRHDHGGTYTNRGDAAKNLAWFNTTGTSMAYQAVTAGEGQPHNNMPPYYVVNMWIRTS